MEVAPHEPMTKGEAMSPSALSLFSEKEQTVLVATEKARIVAMSEDELGDLLTLVRRARDKYSKLHRRQATASIEAAGKRSAASSSNARTTQKTEIFEDALARVSAALAVAARASRDELKKERLAAAAASKAGGAPRARAAEASPARAPRPARKAAAKGGSSAKGRVTERRAATTRASNARSQAKRDRPR